ncbi:hypothetical protein Tco_0193770 [Tanacetum coccineum]
MNSPLNHEWEHALDIDNFDIRLTSSSVPATTLTYNYRVIGEDYIKGMHFGAYTKSSRKSTDLTANTPYYSRPIRRIQDFDELKDHCLTLKNTPFGEGVVISCFCVYFSLIAYSLSVHLYLLLKSLPELFVSSHGGTMTMSLMHQWHDTICGGVIGPRHSLLYGAYGCILEYFHSKAKCETKRETEIASVENDEKKNTQPAFVELSQGEVNTLGLDMS